MGLITGSPAAQLFLITVAVVVFLFILGRILGYLERIAAAQEQQAQTGREQSHHQKCLVEIEAARALIASGQLGSDEIRSIKVKLRNLLGLPPKA